MCKLKKNQKRNYAYDEKKISESDKKALAEYKANKTKKLKSLRDLV